MAKQKKIFAVTASAAILASSVVPVAASAAEAPSFSDAAQIPDHAKDAVNDLVGKGVIKGFTDSNGTSFRPLDNVSRKDAARILAKVVPSSSLTPGDGVTFSDVSKDTDFYDAVDQVSPQYFSGLGGTDLFMPDANLTRQEAAKIIVKAFGLKGTADLSKFKDADKITEDEAVQAAVANGVINGYPSGEFSPNTPIDRADFATFIYRAENPTPATPQVESVSAINGKQIKVTFNKDVDTTSAEFPGNYSVLRNDDTQAVKLSDLGANVDEIKAAGKEVTITFKNNISTDLAVEKDTLFKFTVDGVKDTDGNSFEKSTTSLSVNDQDGPELVSASAAAKTTTNKVTLTFNEPVSATGALVTVDGKSATVEQGNDYNELTVTTSANLEAGKSYDISVLNVKDAVGNFLKTNPTKSSVTVTNDANAPQITKVEAIRDNLIAVTFDKAIDEDSLAGQIKLLDANGAAKGGQVSATVSPDDDKTVEVALGDQDFFGNKTSFTGNLYFSDSIKDVSGNNLAATNKSVTLTKDTVAPTLESVKHLEKGTLYTNGVQYNIGGALVLKFDEGIGFNTAGTIKLLNAAGESVEGTYINTASGTGVNSKDDTELILNLQKPLPAGNYKVVLAGGEVKDLSFEENENAAKTLSVTATATSSDTEKPEVTAADIAATPATSLTSGTTINVPFTDNVGLDLDSVQDINNYLLNGVALPAGSYVTVANNIGAPLDEDAATNVIATIHIPKASISKEGNQTLNVVNVKDKAGNVIDTATDDVTLVDDVAPKLDTAEVASNGSLVLGFSENVNFSTTLQDAASEFVFKINGTNVDGDSANVITPVLGTGNDEGKLVLTFKGLVDAGADAKQDTTADNREFIDVNGNGGQFEDGTDILVKKGTTKDVGATTTVSANDLSSLEVAVDANTYANNIGDNSSLTTDGNALVPKTNIVVK